MTELKPFVARTGRAADEDGKDERHVWWSCVSQVTVVEEGVLLIFEARRPDVCFPP